MKQQTRTNQKIILDQAIVDMFRNRVTMLVRFSSASLQHIHDQTILVADMQGLTDNAHNPAKVSSNILNVVLIGQRWV